VNYTGPQLAVNPTTTTTYTALGSGLELCNDEGTAKIFVSNLVTGLSESNSVILSPNPGTDRLKINIKNDQAGPVEVYVLNMLGAIVNQAQALKTDAELSIELNTKELATGTYLIRVNTNGQIKTKRWVKIL
jgi:hypothetical protein